MDRLCSIALALLALGCRAPAPADAGAGEPREPVSPPTQEAPMCEGQPCESPRQCISYYGIAGPSGPLFHACEIPCSREAAGGGCPEGMRCVTIADGPGDVCQPQS